MPLSRPDRLALLPALLRGRILVLDGGMGTMVQGHRLTEADYRGARFADWPVDLKGNNDLLVLTQPDVIRGIHEAYLEAGADIIETSTFNSTSVSMADYRMESLVPELNRAAAALALEQGALLRPIGNTLYFMPPYVIDESEFEVLVKAGIAIANRFGGAR